MKRFKTGSALLFICFFISSCSTEAVQQSTKHDIAALWVGITNKKLGISLLNVSTGLPIIDVPVQFINMSTGDSFSFTHPFRESELASVILDSGISYKVSLIYKGELFQDSLLYHFVDPNKITIDSYYEEDDALKFYFKTEGINSHYPLKAFYSACFLPSVTPEYTYNGFFCPYFELKDGEKHLALVEATKPKRSKVFNFYLMHTDFRSKQIADRFINNVKATDHEALYSSFANISDFKKGGKILGAFYFVNSIPFSVVYER